MGRAALVRFEEEAVREGAAGGGLLSRCRPRLGWGRLGPPPQHRLLWLLRVFALSTRCAPSPEHPGGPARVWATDFQRVRTRGDSRRCQLAMSARFSSRHRLADEFFTCPK